MSAWMRVPSCQYCVCIVNALMCQEDNVSLRTTGALHLEIFLCISLAGSDLYPFAVIKL